MMVAPRDLFFFHFHRINPSCTEIAALFLLFITHWNKDWNKDNAVLLEDLFNCSTFFRAFLFFRTSSLHGSLCEALVMSVHNLFGPAYEGKRSERRNLIERAIEIFFSHLFVFTLSIFLFISSTLSPKNVCSLKLFSLSMITQLCIKHSINTLKWRRSSQINSMILGPINI